MMVTVQMTETYLEHLLTENLIDKDQIVTVEAIERDLEQSPEVMAQRRKLVDAIKTYKEAYEYKNEQQTKLNDLLYPKQ